MPEFGQLLHNNPVGASMPEFAEALIVAIRDEIARVYWNVNQKPWAGSEDAGHPWTWDEKNPPTFDTGIPGVEWSPYYNWGGCPDDADWDQAKADAPNFAFDGVEIRWYKRFGRSMNVNVQWTPDLWVAWFDRCLDVIRIFENRRECYPREEAIDNGGAARRCPTCDRYYVQIHDKGRCGWDGTALVRVELTADDRASIKRKRDEWRANRKHGLPEGYEIVESVDLPRGWRSALARHDDTMLKMFGAQPPYPKSVSALLLYPCGCVHSSHEADEADCRHRMAAFVESWKDNEASMRKAEKSHEKGPF